ncbi:MAG: hypothetical protein AAFV53_41300 [Myxococcota bacterium]
MSKSILQQLQSPRVQERLDGIERAAKAVFSEVNPQLRTLLDDDIPYLFRRGSRRFVGEVRFDALVALQQLHRDNGVPWDIGPVFVRAAMPLEDVRALAEQTLHSIPETGYQRAISIAGADIDREHGSVPPERELLVMYRALQHLAAIPYDRQIVDPQTLQTPLQAAVLDSQVRDERPRPHLEIRDAQQVLGFIYRTETGWLLDFSESRSARCAKRFVQQVLTIERGGGPAVVYDLNEHPRQGPDGSLVLDGVHNLKTADPVAVLRSIAAFLPERYSNTVRQ